MRFNEGRRQRVSIGLSFAGSEYSDRIPQSPKDQSAIGKKGNPNVARRAQLWRLGHRIGDRSKSRHMSRSRIDLYQNRRPRCNRATKFCTAGSTGIPHIKPPGPKRRTILAESHRSTTHECRQPSHQAHKTIRRRRELVFERSFALTFRAWGSMLRWHREVARRRRPAGL